MRTIRWLIGFVLLAAVVVWVGLGFTATSRTLADVTSPSGDWRVVVRGKELLFRGIEVTAEVHTHDGRRFSLGVIDLRQEWAETEHVYQAHETLNTRIDEVKAVLGSMMNHRLVYRDDYFPDEDFFVSGKIAGERVKMRIGKVDHMSLNFMSGPYVSDVPSASIGIPDLPSRLAAGNVYETNMDDIVIPITIFHWRGSQNRQNNHAMQGGHNKNVSIRLVVEEVTDHVVIGKISITGKDPQVDLAGKFRLVNTIPRTGN